MMSDQRKEDYWSIRGPLGKLEGFLGGVNKQTLIITGGILGLCVIGYLWSRNKGSGKTVRKIVDKADRAVPRFKLVAGVKR